ncbi:hypothetical protein ACFQI7_20765 [Paenibacillus allorhizosphaerae]|uniref:hypothetical protein n=1 Tax=Paenibacillus allorhizosphaerae TaxID=2849866 RepID=UPI001C404F69|nr:hypothetical protein [Paenibacillus allorhizosphaerae]
MAKMHIRRIRTGWDAAKRRSYRMADGRKEKRRASFPAKRSAPHLELSTYCL